MGFNKKLPVWVIILLDLVLTAAVVLSFAYFHHVKDWGKTEGPKKDYNSPSAAGSTIEEHTHSWTEKEVKTPTCLTEGYVLYVCACGEEQKNILPALGHSSYHLVNAKEATEEENGYTGDKYCDICKKLVEYGEVIPAKKYNGLHLVNYSEPTCLEEGYSGDWVNEQGTVVIKGTVLLPLSDSHKFMLERTEVPTCTSEGYSLYRCSACGFEKKDDIQERLPHENDGNGYCRYCRKCLLDTSGDFGSLYPEKFIQDDSVVILKDDAQIRAYALQNRLTLENAEKGTFISFYRSHDVYMSVRQVDEVMNGYLARCYVYDIYVRNIENFYTVAGKATSMENLMEKAETDLGCTVVGAVNGDYWSNSNHCRAAVRNGILLREPSKVDSDLCVLYRDGTMRTYQSADFDWAAVDAAGPWQVWDFGPALLDENGDPYSSFEPRYYDKNLITNTHSRMAVGYHQPGHYTLLSVDGRKKDENGNYIYGCNIPSLAQYMKELGCTVAYNLDGGDSAQAYANGDPIRQAEGRDTQRVISDILCVGEVKKGS
ncbi:MAG: phosphodiester glycosidase family protein [Clostridiales bacterium]|nr:phosphodiester glycosidase family protein [Clostridiales bacterium]